MPPLNGVATPHARSDPPAHFIQSGKWVVTESDKEFLANHAHYFLFHNTFSVATSSRSDRTACVIGMAVFAETVCCFGVDYLDLRIQRLQPKVCLLCLAWAISVPMVACCQFSVGCLNMLKLAIEKQKSRRSDDNHWPTVSDDTSPFCKRYFNSHFRIITY